MTTGKVLLSLDGLSVKRGLSTVLDDFSLRVHSGEILALSGENGCGKSTIIESAAGILALRQGEVRHQSQDDGLNVFVDSAGSRRRLNPFGLCLQQDSTTGEETVLEHLQCAAALSGRSVEEEDLLSLLSTWNLKHRCHDRVGTLSGGLSRRVSVLAAILPAILAEQPRLVMLDEPDDGLDDASRDLLVIHLKSLASAGHGILLASHDENLLKHSDRRLRWVGNKVVEEGETPPFSDQTKSLMRSSEIKTDSTYRRWITRLDLRTGSSLISNGIAAILVILIIIALDVKLTSGTDAWRLWSGLVLAPALVVALIPGPGPRLLERNAVGSWWAAHSAGKAPDAVTVTIPLISMLATLLAIVMIPHQGLPTISILHVFQLLLCSLLLGWFIARVNLALWVVHRWLPRPKQGAQMLLVFMVFPWLLAVDGMTILAMEGVSGDVWTMLAGSFGLLLAIVLILQLVRRA